jgi:hypothetical protein
VVDKLIPRGAIHTLRLALIYALLDKSDELRPEHMAAAAAVWDYCEASAAFVWGTEVVGRRERSLLKAIEGAGAQGLSHTDVERLFRGNLTAADIDALLSPLKANHGVTVATQSTGGRPRRVYFAKGGASA